MNKIKTIKIKNQDDTLSEETYTIAADATNIDMKNKNNLQEVIGDINAKQEGSIEEQLKNKVDKNSIENSLDSSRTDKVLSAKQGKILGDTLNKKTYYCKTIAEMVADNKLKNGDLVVTEGYYSVNDGGAAEYLIRNIKSDDVNDGGSIYFLNSGLVAELIVKNEVNVKQFGAKGDGIANDTLSIQKCFNYCRDKKYEVKINEGTFIVSQLDGYSGMKLSGVNKNKTILKSISNNSCTTGLLRFMENAIVRPSISNLMLDGNKTNNINIFDGLYFYTEQRQTDSYLNIQSIEIQNFTGNGLVFDGTASTYCIREARVNDVRCSSNDGYGFYINSATDNMFLQNTACFNKKSGFYIKGANQKFISCKAHTNGIGDEETIDLSRTPASAYEQTSDTYYISSKTYYTRSGTEYNDNPYTFSKFTGSSFQPGITYYELKKDYYKRYPGFEILSSRSSFSSCEAQDNYADGAYVQGLGNSIMSFIGDNNGFLTVKGEGTGGTKISYEDAGLEQIYDGIHIYSCNSINISGIFNNFRKNETGICQRAGVGIDKSSIINVNIICSNQIVNYIKLSSGNTVSIIVNGQEAIEEYDISRFIIETANYSIYSANTNESTVKRIGNKVFLHLCIDGTNGIPASNSDIDILTLPSGFRPLMHHCYNGMLSNNHGYSIAGNGTINIYKTGMIGIRGNSNVNATSIIIDCCYETNL